jgi:hypothetical protein
MTYDVDPITDTEYNSVESINLKNNPQSYEGEKISSGGLVVAIDRDTIAVMIVLTTDAEIDLRIPTNSETIKENLDDIYVGGYVVFRGVSKLDTLGYIEVEDVHIHTKQGRFIVYGFSGPAFFVFVWFFFRIYRFDMKTLQFVPKKKKEGNKDA